MINPPQQNGQQQILDLFSADIGRIKATQHMTYGAGIAQSV
jgi:hypothetical protein